MNQAQAGYRGTTRETWFGVQSATISMTSGWRSCDLGSPLATGRAGRRRWLACDLELFGLDVEVVTIERTLVDLLGPAPRRTSGDTTEWVRRLVQHDGVLVAVEDAGPDVLSELPERIPTPFRRGGAGRWLGIGLAEVRRVVLLHGGRVRVEDRVAAGVLLRAWLPASAGRPCRAWHAG